MNRNTKLSVVLMALISLALAISTSGYFAGSIEIQNPVCGTGQYKAILTGWDFNGSTPKGEASYDSNKNLLVVEVENVKLKDGAVLDVLIGDDRIGRMEALKDGAAKASITPKDKLDEKSRVRVFDDERPIVSANLQCDAAQTDQN